MSQLYVCMWCVAGYICMLCGERMQYIFQNSVESTRGGSLTLTPIIYIGTSSIVLYASSVCVCVCVFVHVCAIRWMCVSCQRDCYSSQSVETHWAGIERHSTLSDRGDVCVCFPLLVLASLLLSIPLSPV